MFHWMAWTTPVAVFFICILFMLIGTTRGDRLFMGLLGAAYINLAFVGMAGWFTEWLSLEQEPSIWISFVISMVWLVVTLRKG
jgi:predicted small integral membrane protein